MLEVNFTVMMELVFLCEELSKLDTSLKTRMDTEVVEETGFWGSLLRGFKVVQTKQDEILKALTV